MNQHLIVFVKNPELGKVKTRIAATAGDKQALAIYRQLLEVTQHTICGMDTKVHIYYSTFIDNHDQFNATHLTKSVQVDGDLGEKMKAAFQDIFIQNTDNQSKTKVVIMGSDCPDLSVGILHQAFTALDDHAVVIGPTFDGGYYSLGMDDFYPELFDDIMWSTSEVFNKTIQKAEQQNLSYFKLPTLRDIDHEEDWIAYQSRQSSIK